MPNGGHASSDEISAYKDFFAISSDVITDFASTRNLVIDKYYHESPTWNLRFRHPKGGEASIQVERRNAESGSVSGVWHIDDYDKGTRTIVSGGQHEFKIPGESLKMLLDATLGQVLRWEISEGKMYVVGSEWKKVWSKDEFERMSMRLPMVTLAHGEFVEKTIQQSDAEKIFR